MDELELVRRAQAGERAAVEALLERHLGALEAYVRLRVGRAFGAREGASDLVQSTCRDLLERMDGFRHGDEAAFRHWLYATAARKIADRFAYHGAERREAARERPSHEASAILGAAFAGVASPSEVVMGAELVERLQRAFGELEDDEREVVLLSRVVGLSRAEVARALGRSEAGTRNLLHRTLVKLAELLDLEA